MSVDWGTGVETYEATTGTRWLSRAHLAEACQPSLQLDLASMEVTPSSWFVPRPVGEGDGYAYTSIGDVHWATWVPGPGGVPLRLERGQVTLATIGPTQLTFTVEGVFCDEASACDAGSAIVDIQGISDPVQSYEDLGEAPRGCAPGGDERSDAFRLDGLPACGPCPIEPEPGDQSLDG